MILSHHHHRFFSKHIARLCVSALLVIAALSLSACDNQVGSATTVTPNTNLESVPKCIQADDWGYPKIYVNARPDDHDVFGEQANQTSRWFDSGQVILDAANEQTPLMIRVSVKRANDNYSYDDKWTSWYNGNKTFVAPDRFCQYANGKAGDNADSCPFVPKVRATTTSSDFDSICSPTNVVTIPEGEKDKNADCRQPCWFKEGYGLYIMASPSGNPDNGGITKHLGRAGNNGVLFNAAASTAGFHTGDRLFFRIVDRYYEDNAGGYLVQLVKGTRSATSGPLESIYYAFFNPTLNIMERLYNGLIKNSNFISAVRAALVLYVTLLGLIYVVGVQGMKTYGDLFIAALRIGIVLQLISDSSWEFFYTHFFTFFLDGTHSLAAAMIPDLGDGGVDPNSPMYRLDKLLMMFMSQETNIKIASLLFTHYMFIGMVYMGILYFCMGYVAIALAKALALIVFAFFVSAVLITLAPIFIVFILFSKTRELFSEWIQQLFAFSIQQIVVFFSVGMFAILITDQLQKTLGVRVCWRHIVDIFPDPFKIFELNFWMPTPSNFQGPWQIIANGHIAYETRYLDVPYLDPTVPAEMNQISRFLSGTTPFTAQYLDIVDLLLFVLVTYLFANFLDIVPVISDTLKGGGLGRFQSAGLFASTAGRQGIGITNTLWENLKDQTLGQRKPGKTANRAAGATNGLSKAFYQLTDRSGGILGGIMRAPFTLWEEHKSDQDKKKKEKERERKIEELKQRQANQNGFGQRQQQQQDQIRKADEDIIRRREQGDMFNLGQQARQGDGKDPRAQQKFNAAQLAVAKALSFAPQLQMLKAPGNDAARNAAKQQVQAALEQAQGIDGIDGVADLQRLLNGLA